jgi:hypothetical protein
VRRRRRDEFVPWWVYAGWIVIGLAWLVKILVDWHREVSP